LVDFLVELRNVMPATPYFFVQVRATRRGATRDGRLRVRVSDSDIRRLAAHFAPTYLVGIDEANETGYIISANGEARGGLSSFPTAYPLDDVNQRALWQEVRDFWTRADAVRQRPTSRFIDPQWR
jgi:hypothetical protein